MLGPICRHAEDLAPLTSVIVTQYQLSEIITLLQVLLGANTGLLNLAATDTAALSQCSFHLLTTRLGGNSVSPTDPEVTMCLQRVRGGIQY